MAATRKHRIVKRAVLTLVVPVLLVSGYVGSWLAVSRAATEGLIGWEMTLRIRPAFIPLIWYCESDLAGADLLDELWWTATDRPLFYSGKPPADWNLRQ